MHWNVIDKNRFEMLKKIVTNVRIPQYYMAGGTALALQLGTRESFDFDFFVMERFDLNELIEQLNLLGNLEVTYARESTLHCVLDGVNISFIYFPNKLIDKLIEVDEVKGLYLANMKDIAAMKLIAISQRGAKKDYFDLYQLCQNKIIDIESLLELLKIKYEDNKINYAHIIKSLSFFDDADNEILPKVFIDYDWNKIKEFYEVEQRKFM